MPEEEKQPTPVTEPVPAPPEAAPPDADALRRELETLREEKRLRTLTQQAEALLRESSLPEGFAPFLLGSDGEDTAKRVADFGRIYVQALQEKLRAAALPQPPRDLSLAPPARRHRGIRKL